MAQLLLVRPMATPCDFTPHDPDLAQYVEREPQDPLFNEELRTHSAEEYQALKREVERLRRRCDKQSAAQDVLQGQLEDANEVLAERDVLMNALVEFVRAHPELQQEILASIAGEALVKELTDAIAEPPESNSGNDEESLE